MTNDVEVSVREFLVNTAGVDAALLEDPMRKVTELGLDSLGIVELLFEVEDKFGIRIDDAMTIKNFTLQQLFVHFAELRVAQSPAQPGMSVVTPADAVAHA